MFSLNLAPPLRIDDVLQPWNNWHTYLVYGDGAMMTIDELKDFITSTTEP